MCKAGMQLSVIQSGAAIYWCYFKIFLYLGVVKFLMARDLHTVIKILVKLSL